MEIKINKKEIEKNIGIFCTDEKDYINFMQTIINDLYIHNKNYTKKQYFQLENIKEILDNIEIL